MANNTVTVSGMFGSGKTYFAGSPVTIDISGLEWPTDAQTGETTSPFNVVRVEVARVFHTQGETDTFVVVGDFRIDTGGQSETSFDISSALRALWSDERFAGEVTAAQAAVADDATQQSFSRAMREYVLRIYTEYLSSDGVFTETQCEDAQGNTDIPGGQCLLGGYTEWERSLIDDPADRDVSHLEHSGVRNGDASSKPTDSPERVGSTSITSWVDVYADGTKSIFYPATEYPDGDDTPGSQQGWTGHAPIVLRDTVPYVDFLFVNKRGAVETCSALMKEAQTIEVETTQYAYSERPAFKPSRSLLAIANGGRKSWSMSSGLQTREWLEWWTMEFLMASQWWMLYEYNVGGETQRKYVPVTVKPAKKSVSTYDRSKQKMESVEFTVTMALEG